MYARGVRDAEERLIQEVLSLETQRGGDLAALAQPIRIVVPSSSLRKHLSAALVRRAGHSLLSVRLHTLRGTAQRIVEGAEGEPAKSDRLFPLLCRREVAKEPTLREALEELEDGFGAVVGTLSDLLDAGLEAPLDEALLESLEELVPASKNIKTTKIIAAKR
jgi:riboflavin biosynthesis pyrimidine reductase